MKTCLLLSLVLVGHATADEAADKVAEELAAAYKNTGGFIAKYHSESKGKTLDATVGLDIASGLMVSTTALADPEKPADIGRMWNIPGDVFYIQRGDQTLKMEGMMADLKFLNHLSATVARSRTDPPPSPVEPTLIGGTMLTTEGMTSGLAGSSSDWKPFWRKSVEGSTIQSQSPESVTFQTKDDGLVTIERASGLLLSQSTPNRSGSIRTLALLEPIVLNPGKDRVVALTAGWSTATVTVRSSGSLTNAARALQFQDIIGKVEHQIIDVGRVESALGERKDELRQLAARWATNGELAQHADWKTLMEKCKEQARRLWLQQLPPGAKGADEATFEIYLGSSAFRADALEGLVEGIVRNKGLKEAALNEMFQPRLSATTELGEIAKTKLEDAMVGAYMRAIMDQKIHEYWGERKGLD